MEDIKYIYSLLMFMFLSYRGNGFTNSVDDQLRGRGPRIISLHIKSNILYRFSTTNVVSTMVNDGITSAETTFDVTLPDTAFISNFTLEMDGKVYSGEVKEKEKAKEQYEKAKWRGHSAAHIGTRPRDSNRFQVSINIAALSEVTFSLTYNELLQRRRGIYEHIIYVNPRQIIDNLLIEVTIQESRRITKLKVPPLRNDLLTSFTNNIWSSYATVSRPSQSSAYIRYNPSTEDQKRTSLEGLSGLFIVEYDVERHTDAGEILIVNGYFVHYFAPHGHQRMRRRILFILDSSGSMSGTKIKQLKDAMLEILTHLDRSDKFNIIQFSGGLSRWWNRSSLMEVTPSSIQSAKEFIKGIQADGWTNIYAAVIEGIKLIHSTKDTSSTPLIVFLTDGEPTEGETDPEKILKTVQSSNDEEVPIFSLSFGDDADYNFLRKMSAQNNGFVRKIYEASDAKLQLTGFYKEISSTIYSKLTFRYLDGTVVKPSMTNLINPYYFEGSELVIAGKLENSSNEINEVKFEVVGKGANGPLQMKSIGKNILDFQKDAPDQEIANTFSDLTKKIWAYLTIKQLLIDRLRERNQTVRDILKQKVTDLALQHNFVTPLTSMVVTNLNEEDSFIGSDDDYELNDSPNSVWGSALTASRGLALAGKSPSFVDSDPHFIIQVKGLDTSICFDVMGNQGDVYNLVRDEISGIVVNAEIASNVVSAKQRKVRRITDSDKQNKTKSGNGIKTYLGTITISGDRTRVEISPDKWKVQGRTYKWHPAQSVNSYRTKIVTDGTGKMIAIMFPNRITLLVIRHLRRKSQLRAGKINFLGFYIVDDRGFSWHTHGLLGQFIYRHITLEKRRKAKGGKTRGRLKINGNTKRVRRVSVSLGKRLNLATHMEVTCWMVQKNGKRLIDGNYTDYKVKNSSVSSANSKKRHKKTVK